MAAAKPEVVIILGLKQVEMWFQVILPYLHVTMQHNTVTSFCRYDAIYVKFNVAATKLAGILNLLAAILNFSEIY